MKAAFRSLTGRVAALLNWGAHRLKCLLAIILDAIQLFEHSIGNTIKQLVDTAFFNGCSNQYLCKSQGGLSVANALPLLKIAGSGKNLVITVAVSSQFEYNSGGWIYQPDRL